MAAMITIIGIPADVLARIEAFRDDENARLPALREKTGLPWLPDSTIESATYVLILRALNAWEKEQTANRGEQ